MEVERAGEVVVERDGVVVDVLGGDGVDEAVALLDTAEEAVGAPLVDESERARLEALLDGAPSTEVPHWHPLLARRGDDAVGYAGLHLPDGELTGDLAVPRTEHQDGATTALLEGVRRLVRRHDAERAAVWIRHARERDVACAAAAEFVEDRRLLVLGRPLDGVRDEHRGLTAPSTSAPPDPDAVRIRSFRGGADDQAVVDVLASAFAGTPDAGWDLERLAERRAYDWFDPEDVLVAETADDGIVAVHWTKRRGGAVGEVYVLGVSPHAHGRGLGRTMLRAGLAHLAEIGCEEVILWVDAANEPAVRMYLAEGFTERWTDVAFRPSLR